MSLPKGYIEGVTRVSNVVSFKYPFDGNAQERYLDWLYKNKINEREYMKEAQDVGTFIHLQMENYIDNKPIQIKEKLYSKHKEEVDYGIEYIQGLQNKYPGVKWETEVVVCDKLNRYQGSVDCIRICEKTKTVWVYDWKSRGIAKKRYGLPNKATKNSDKLKKVALQLSLYAETYRQKGYRIGGIYVVWLHETGAIEYNLFAENHRQKVPDIRLWTTEEIDELLSSYLVSKTRLPPNFTLIINKGMKIEIQTTIPNEQYSKASIIFEQEDMLETPEKSIAEVIRLQKYLVSKYET